MPLSPVAAQHLRELAARKSKLYELPIALEANPSADESCFHSLGRVVDRALFNEISLDAAALGDLKALVTTPAEDLASNLAVLALAVAEAEPDRGRVQLLLTGFPKWLQAVSIDARPQFLGILPNVAPLLSELRGSGVDALIACFNACASAADCEIVAGCVARYQETSGDIVAAAAKIASLAVRAGSPSTVERLMAVVTPESMLESKDARALLPAMAKLEYAGAVAVCIEAARHNPSSALRLAQTFAAPLAPLPAGTREAYLNSFRRMVEETGTSLLAYGSKELPELFQKAGVDRAGQFVEEGIAIARRYGSVAAQEFFERKTPASKQASPLG